MHVPTRVLFVCLGNICRSPLAEGIARAHLVARELERDVVVDSAGTSGEHDGEPPDPGSVRVAREFGLDISAQRSRRITPDDVVGFDVIVAMDRSNLRNVERVGHGEPDRLLLLRTFDPRRDAIDVPDPWAQGPAAFREVYAIIDRSMPALLDAILRLGPR